MVNCTGMEDSSDDKICSDYDICHVSCPTRDHTCGDTCTFIGQNINGSNYNCDDDVIYSAFKNMYDDFEAFGECFNNTNYVVSGEDYYLICNMGSSKSTDWARIIVPIVSITAVYCCIWFVWRQSEADEKSFWKSRMTLSMSTLRGDKKDTSTTATQSFATGKTTN